MCDCCCKCVYARFARVCACMHTITTADDAWVGVIYHNVTKQDVSYYCILYCSQGRFIPLKCDC